MPEETERFKIKKFQGTDLVRRSAFNENYDIIDAKGALDTEVVHKTGDTINGVIEFLNTIKIGGSYRLQEVDGDLWFSINAYYDFENECWNRIETDKFAFGLQFQGQGVVPGEPVQGVTLWKCVPGDNPILGYTLYGGWELAFTVTGFATGVLGGMNFEIDGSGTVSGYGRINQKEDGTYFSRNAFFDGTKWVKDNASYPATAIKITQNGNLIYLRDMGTTSQDITWTEEKLWNSTNMGEDSGLDADTVDGYQSSDLAKEEDFEGALSDIYINTWVVTGMEATKDTTINNKLNISAGIAYLETEPGKIERIKKDATSFYTTTPSTYYRLELLPDKTYAFGTTPSGVIGAITLAMVETDLNGNISYVVDHRPTRPEPSPIRINYTPIIGTGDDGASIAYNLKDIPNVILSPAEIKTYDSNVAESQKVVIEPLNITNTGFKIKAGLYRIGASVSNNLNQTITTVGSSYTSNELDPANQAVTEFIVKGRVELKVVSLQGLPGAFGYGGARIKIEKSYYTGSEWSSWDAVFEGNIYFYTDWNPWSAPEYRTWVVPFSLGATGLAAHNWKFKVTYLSRTLANSNYGWVDGRPYIYIDSETHKTDIKITGGKVMYYIFPKF